ncbi:MAG: hypothetical protein QOG53_1730 [Frankiales bacterium]|jgi:hypothetical protein|nr:hypothetical protein [Frankiales bacterium]
MGKHAYARTYVRAQGRHRRPVESRPIARTAVAAGGLTASALVVGGLVAPSALAASNDDFARLRMCESGGNYKTNTGNGYYGAYQFSSGTWHGLGYSGLPSNAAPGTQDAAAHKLQARSGWGQWPACSRKLGLGSSHASQSTGGRYRAASSTHAVVVHPSGPVILSTDYVGVWRADVRDLQTKLNMVGFVLDTDGKYGQQTADVVSIFQKNAGITVDGRVGPVTQNTLQRQLIVVAHLMALGARA